MPVLPGKVRGEEICQDIFVRSCEITKPAQILELAGKPFGRYEQMSPHLFLVIFILYFCQLSSLLFAVGCVDLFIFHRCIECIVYALDVIFLIIICTI